MTVCPVNQISLGIHPVWLESLLCTQWVAKDSSFLHADSKDADQTGRMPRLICVFAGRTLILLDFSCRGSFYACSLYLQAWRRSNQKWRRYRSYNIFPIISLWELLVAMETRVLIWTAPKLASEIFKFESVDSRLTTGYWYSISPPCEPLAQVS